jgi:hypothetical protein
MDLPASRHLLVYWVFSCLELLRGVAVSGLATIGLRTAGGGEHGRQQEPWSEVTLEEVAQQNDYTNRGVLIPLLPRQRKCRGSTFF